MLRKFAASLVVGAALVAAPAKAQTITALATTYASTATTIAFTGLAAAGYPRYLLQCTGLLMSGDSQVGIQIGQGGTPTWKTASYSAVNVGSSAALYNATALAGINLFNNSNQIDSAYPLSFTMLMPALTGGTDYKNFYGQITGKGNSTFTSWLTGSYVGDATAATAVRVSTTIDASTNFTHGVCSLFGLNP